MESGTLAWNCKESAWLGATGFPSARYVRPHGLTKGFSTPWACSCCWAVGTGLSMKWDHWTSAGRSSLYTVKAQHTMPSTVTAACVWYFGCTSVAPTLWKHPARRCGRPVSTSSAEILMVPPQVEGSGQSYPNTATHRASDSIVLSKARSSGVVAAASCRITPVAPGQRFCKMGTGCSSMPHHIPGHKRNCAATGTVCAGRRCFRKAFWIRAAALATRLSPLGKVLPSLGRVSRLNQSQAFGGPELV